MLFEPLHVGNGAVVPYNQIVAPMLSKGMNDENGAVLPYKQIATPMPSERLYEGIEEKSIGYPRKVYRLFSDRIGQTIRYLPSSALIPPYKRFVSSHPRL